MVPDFFQNLINKSGSFADECGNGLTLIKAIKLSVVKLLQHGAPHFCGLLWIFQRLHKISGRVSGHK
jgi:hypothetical protein